jgi:hypothetical protein
MGVTLSIIGAVCFAVMALYAIISMFDQSISESHRRDKFMLFIACLTLTVMDILQSIAVYYLK